MPSVAEQSWLAGVRGGSVKDFYAVLGVSLPDGGSDVSVQCFSNTVAHKHDDRVKSCSVSLGTGLWKCHGCGEAGNAFAAARSRGYSERDAAQLAKDHGLFMEREKPKLAEPRKWQAWHRALMGDDRLLARLYELRGWTPWAIRRLAVGFDGERIVFPIRDAKRTIIGIVRYQPNPEHRNGGPKTLALAGSKRDLFPAPETIARLRPVFIVEGEPDAVAVWSVGLPAVGVPGTASWRADWGMRFYNRRVVVLCDCDPQGRDLAAKVQAGIPHAKVVDLEPGVDDGRDIGDWVREASREGGLGQVKGMLERLAA